MEGVNSSWKGYFNEGVPVRSWVFSIDSIDGKGKLVDQFLRANMPYNNGKIEGKFTVQNFKKGNEYKLVGYTNKNGEADKKWEFSYENNEGIATTEWHTFEAGILKEVLIEQGDSQWVAWNKNAWFFEEDSAKLLNTQIGDSVFSISEYEGETHQFWKVFAHKQYLAGWNLEQFNFDFKLLLPIFKRIEYPFSKEEIDLIANTKNRVQFLIKNIDNYVEGEMLIQRSRSADLDLSISYLESTKKRMLLVDSLLNRTSRPHFTYKNRYQKGVLKYIEAVNKINEVKAQVYDTLSLSLPMVETKEDSFYLFKSLENLVSQSEIEIEKHIEIIENQTLFLQRKSEQKELENTLGKNLVQLQNDLQEEERIGALIRDKWVDKFLQNQIIEYAQINDYNKAMDLGDKILDRIDTIAKMKEHLPLFDSMLVKINQEYTRMVFNPFTGKNDIEQILKKRFLNNINIILWPWLETQIYTTDNWTLFYQLWDQQFDVFNYIMTFANREDKAAQKINKRVRKEDNPERILKLLN